MTIEHFIEFYVRGEDEMYFVRREKCTCPEGHDHRSVSNG